MYSVTSVLVLSRQESTSIRVLFFFCALFVFIGAHMRARFHRLLIASFDGGEVFSPAAFCHRQLHARVGRGDRAACDTGFLHRPGLQKAAREKFVLAGQRRCSLGRSESHSGRESESTGSAQGEGQPGSPLGGSRLSESGFVFV